MTKKGGKIATTTTKQAIAEVVGQNIAARRREKGLTQHELAARLGTRESNVSAWEQGRNLPRPAALEQLAEAFGCPVHSLFQA